MIITMSGVGFTREQSVREFATIVERLNFDQGGAAERGELHFLAPHDWL